LWTIFDNVIAVKKGKTGSPKVMLAAHMDEIGLMVKQSTRRVFYSSPKWAALTIAYCGSKSSSLHKERASPRNNWLKTAPYTERGGT